MANKAGTAHPPGAGVDAAGNPVLDPTANVLALVEAANKRQDDLRELNSKWIEVIAALREQHAKELREAEAKRIDAIRQVDTEAVSQAAIVADTRAQTLAVQVQSAAETVRSTQDQTRIQFAATMATAVDPLAAAIADLRRIQYEQQGQKVAATEQHSTNQWTVGTVIGILALLVSIIVGAIVIEHEKTAAPATPTTIVCSGTPIVCKTP
jgi:hypothetical protein